MSFDNVSARADADLPSLPAEEWLDRIRPALATAPILKNYGAGSSTYTYRLDLEGYGPVWLKEYRLDRTRKFLSLFRQSRGEHVWWISDQLLACGCEVPKPLLLVEVHAFGVLQESYLATEWLEGRRNLLEWYRSSRSDPEKRERVEDTILHAVRTAADFHRNGVIHGDLKWSNFLLPPPGEEGIILTDLDATRFESGPGARGRDLAPFARSALEEGIPAGFVNRVFKVYVDELNPPSPDRVRKAFERYLGRKIPLPLS